MPRMYGIEDSFIGGFGRQQLPVHRNPLYCPLNSAEAASQCLNTSYQSNQHFVSPYQAEAVFSRVGDLLRGSQSCCDW